jgi:oligosaccharide repeat unit polymerase
MSDFPVTPNSSYFAADQPLILAGAWSEGSGSRSQHSFASGTFRPRRELPIYCNPVALFLAVWILMLACLSVHVSYVIYPDIGIPFLIFFVSAGSMLLGYFASTAILERDTLQDEVIDYVLDVTRLWRMNLLFCAFALVLIGFNWYTSGPPPAIGDPTTYLTYGNLKQILFPLLTCIAVNATLDPLRLRRYLLIAFALSILAIYLARGILLITFLQMFFFFSLKSGMSRRKQYLLALGALVFAIIGVTTIGNLRTAHDIFIEFLQIREKYSDWPMAFLWVVSYISIPFSNLCWMVAHGPSHGPTFAFLYSMLPSFMTPSDPYADVFGSMNIIDGASTYLLAWALDFSYLGIYFANLLIGIGCGWLAMRAYPRNVLILAIFLTSISVLFFSNTFFLLSTALQVVFQVFVARRCFHWPQPRISYADEAS